jgi:APA family basic amino acid/polyamine antiporter
VGPAPRPRPGAFRGGAGQAGRELDEAVAIGESYGVKVVDRLVRARDAGGAIVDEARARNAEIIVLGAPRRRLGRRERAVFGRTVDHVLRHAPCRVLVTSAAAEAAA